MAYEDDDFRNEQAGGRAARAHPFPRNADLVVFRGTDELVHANVPRTVYQYLPPPPGSSDDGYDAGEAQSLSPAGLELALNVLAAYVPPRADGRGTFPARFDGLASETARELHEDFALEFLAPLNSRDASLELPAEELYAWLRRKAGLPTDWPPRPR